MVGGVAGQGAANRIAYLAARAVCTNHIFGPDNLLPAFLGACSVKQGHRDRILALAGDLQAPELKAVVRHHAGRRVRHEFSEVVQHAGLVDDEVRELTDPHLVVHRAGSPDDARVVGRVRLPERHFGDVVRLGDDPLGEAEGLEGLDAPRLDAVCLADGQPAGTAFHDPRGDARELGQLGGGQHAGRACADNQDVHFIRKLSRPIDAYACCRLDSRVTGYVTVMVELHGGPHFIVWRRIAVFGIRYKNSVFDNRNLMLIQNCTQI
ncbi:hypothetical protein D9M72_411580 [compost metagenome]